MNDEATRTPGSRFLKAVVRLLLVIVIGAAIGAGAYFGLPLAYRGLVEPVQLNADRIESLEQQLERARADLAELSERTTERTAELEAGSVETRESLAELQAGSERDLAQLERELDGLSSELDQLEQSIQDQGETLEQLLDAPDEPDAELHRELAVNRALLHLMRARLWLIENNPGLAAQQVQAAQAELSGLEGLDLAVERLDQALVELDSTPLVAAEDLEIAWMLLTTEREQSPSGTEPSE